MPGVQPLARGDAHRQCRQAIRVRGTNVRRRPRRRVRDRTGDRVEAPGDVPHRRGAAHRDGPRARPGRRARLCSFPSGPSPPTIRRCRPWSRRSSVRARQARRSSRAAAPQRRYPMRSTRSRVRERLLRSSRRCSRSSRDSFACPGPCARPRSRRAPRASRRSHWRVSERQMRRATAWTSSSRIASSSRPDDSTCSRASTRALRACAAIALRIARCWRSFLRYSSSRSAPVAQTGFMRKVRRAAFAIRSMGAARPPCDR